MYVCNTFIPAQIKLNFSFFFNDFYFFTKELHLDPPQSIYQQLVVNILVIAKNNKNITDD